MDVRNKIEAAREAKYKDDSKAKLKKVVSQKIRTTMIGALNAVEKRLGFMWGLDEYGKESDDDLTPSQERIKDIFEQLRSDILDLGNNQIRNCDTEIEQYDVKFNKYHLNLPVRPEGPVGGSYDN